MRRMKQPVSYITCALLLLLALVPPVAWAPNYIAGDVAPRGNTDDQLNAGDLVVLQRIAIGQTTADAYEWLVGDVAPLGAPDGQINAADGTFRVASPLNEGDRLTAIRDAANGNYALGDGRFQEEVEKILRRRVVPGKNGRPAKRKISDSTG